MTSDLSETSAYGKIILKLDEGQGIADNEN